MSNVSNATTDHYLHLRIEAYTYTSLLIGPMASAAGVVLIFCEHSTSKHRVVRERISFHAVASSIILAGLMQLMFGIFYFRMLQFKETGFETVSEFLNAVYMMAIIFSTATILQISFQRWVDINSLRVRGIRPLSNRHWMIICTFTTVAVVVILLNKVAYLRLAADKKSVTRRICHTISIVAILMVWSVIFLALLYYNIQVLKIARGIHKHPVRSPSSMEALNQSTVPRVKRVITRRETGRQGRPPLNTQWLRLTLFIYNFASVLFVLKVVDYIYLSQHSQKPHLLSYPSSLHIVMTVNHILQTVAILTTPIVWLMTCTHLYVDYVRSKRQTLVPPSTTAETVPLNDCTSLKTDMTADSIEVIEQKVDNG